jgi:hypothetical protein
MRWQRSKQANSGRAPMHRESEWNLRGQSGPVIWIP